jgi:hypothetical protein
MPFSFSADRKNLDEQRRVLSELQIATAGLSNWLKSYDRLNTAEIATVLAASMHYDIAEVADPEVHVVTKIKKEVLSQIPKPERPFEMLCQARRGCALNAAAY